MKSNEFFNLFFYGIRPMLNVTKTRGMEDVLFISMDVSGLEEGAKAIFKDVIVQCCIVHLIRILKELDPYKMVEVEILNPQTGDLIGTISTIFYSVDDAGFLSLIVDLEE